MSHSIDFNARVTFLLWLRGFVISLLNRIPRYLFSPAQSCLSPYNPRWYIDICLRHIIFSPCNWITEIVHVFSHHYWSSAKYNKCSLSSLTLCTLPHIAFAPSLGIGSDIFAIYLSRFVVNTLGVETDIIKYLIVYLCTMDKGSILFLRIKFVFLYCVVYSCN